MKQIIIYIFFAFLSQFFVYKWIKKIDMKERKKLKTWEKSYIDEFAPLWKNAHFDQLAIEKKIKEYESLKKKEKQEIKDKLKDVNIDDQFHEIYENDLNNAIEKLEKLEN